MEFLCFKCLGLLNLVHMFGKEQLVEKEGKQRRSYLHKIADTEFLWGRDVYGKISLKWQELGVLKDLDSNMYKKQSREERAAQFNKLGPRLRFKAECIRED